MASHCSPLLNVAHLHFRIHAADVVRTLYCVLTQGGVLKTLFPEATDTGMLVSLFSAIVHDYGHKGYNVSFSGFHPSPLIAPYQQLIVLTDQSTLPENDH